jgi:hypothetical protein
MTSSALSPPKRRTRILVITIAVLALGLGWYSWSLMRVDQRFVGTWSMTPGAEISADDFASGATIRFKSYRGAMTRRPEMGRLIVNDAKEFDA